MVYDNLSLSGFEEFKNTTASKKLIETDNKVPQLKFRKIPYKNKTDIGVILNRPLLRLMKDNKVFTFKLLFNESNGKVAIKYDNSSNAMTLVNRSTRPNGDIVFSDKFITATMLPLLGNHSQFIYECKFIKEQLIYIFTLVKKK